LSQQISELTEHEYTLTESVNILQAKMDGMKIMLEESGESGTFFFFACLSSKKAITILQKEN
jgi:hypothetical protein